MAVKRFLLFAVVICLTLSYAVKASRYGGDCHLYLNSTSSLGFQLREFNNVSITMNSGELNSSSSTITNDYMRGNLVFNSSTPGSFTVAHSEGVRVWFNRGSYLDSGTLVNYAALTSNILQWDIHIFDPFEYYTYPAIGLIGFILTSASGFYLAKKIRDRDDDMIMGIAYAIVMLILGGGFIIVWLWG